MRLPENRRYSMGVSKNPFPRSTTSENDFWDTHLVSVIYLATLHSFAICLYSNKKVHFFYWPAENLHIMPGMTIYIDPIGHLKDR